MNKSSQNAKFWLDFVEMKGMYR